MPKFERCPFCGSGDLDDDLENRLEGAPAGTHCLRCGAFGPGNTPGNWDWVDRAPGPATQMVMKVASAVFDQPQWSKEMRKIFKDFLEEWGRQT